MTSLQFAYKEIIAGHHLQVTPRGLVVDAKKSLNHNKKNPLDDNLVIYGDNLEALKALLPMYAGRVNCVYIDPPYNTGNENWAYDDNVNDPVLKQWFQKTVDVDDLERHDKWCCMMWPRLQLLRELLADDGVIFVSVDDNEQHNLKMMMDEIFGEANFFATLCRRAMHTVRNSSKDFNLNADYVMVYAKQKEWFSKSKDRYIRHMVDKADNYPHDDDDGRGKYKLDPLSARNYYTPYEHTFSNGVRWKPPAGSYPRYSIESLQQMEKDGRIVFSGREPKAKRYLSEVQQGQPPNVMLDPEIVGFNADGTRELRDIFGEGGVFPQPKPTKLIKFLLEILRKKNAIVLDSFAGSGTTAHSVLALNNEDGGNRKFILVELKDYANKITAERVRRVIKGVSQSKDVQLKKGLVGSFTYCTLGKPIDIEDILTGKSLPDTQTLASLLLYRAASISTEKELKIGADRKFYSTATTDYYLFYKPDMEYLQSHKSSLTEERAEVIAAKGRNSVVFAPDKTIGQRDLSRMGITFCRLPGAILNVNLQ